MDCPKTLTEKISTRLTVETELSEEAIQQLARYLEGESSRSPDWNIILKPAASQPESTEP